MSTASDGFTPDIVALAVDYHRSPLKYRPLVLPPAEIPEDAGKLLHVACGDGELLAELSRQAEVTPSQLKTAVEFYIRQAFFARDADYYRVLGLRSTDGIERIKEHHRLLMKLFHPDRGDTEGAWTDALATRVNQAYTVLRKPESRREYDASLRAPQPAAMTTVNQGGTMKSRWVRMPRPELGARIDGLPPGVRRHFPEFVLGGIGMFAALVVGALYFFQEPPLTGSGAIGGLAKSAPANVAGKRGVADTAEKFTTASPSSENTQDDASRGGRPAESVASLSVPATADPQSPATVAPVVIAANESPAATASDMPISIPAPPEPVAAKTVAPKAHAKTPEAPSSAPVPLRVTVADAGRTPIALAPPPPPAKAAQAQAKAIPTTAPPAARPRTEGAKPVTVAAASAVGTASEVKTVKASVPEAVSRAAVISPPPAVPARTTAKTVVAGAAPVSTMAAALPVPRQAFPDLELERLIGRFIGSYEQGDLDRFMALFHKDAEIGVTKDNKATTRKQYADLFASTQVRQMMLRGLRWEKGEELVLGQSRFLARVAGQDDSHIREYAGSLRIEVANVDGNLLIKSLFHSIEAKKHIPRGTEGRDARGQ